MIKNLKRIAVLVVTAALPANLQTIGDWAFGNCTALAYLEIPRSVTEIADTAFFGDENLTLGVWLDSYAHTFAKENGCAYRLLDPVTLGDANGDGFVNINDVTALQQHLAELQELSDLGAKAADINMDNKLEIEDATTLQMFLAEYVLSYPVGETV
ncbi:MAG: leucine-rich repeat protein [Ruminococcus sp.]|nr:leucine-rich repeat protein [Ruminococcus sp.]MBQ5640865.1 leucine-rich repeat protein [Ruminococcus sp.]